MAEGLGGLPRSTRGVQKATVVTRHVSSDFVDKHYETLEVIGEGSFGTVMRVRDRKTSEERVCKVVSTEGMEPRLLEMMRKEIEMLCVLDHPHIVKIFEYALDESREELVLVLEHLKGGDCQDVLTEALAAGSLLSEALVARLLHQVLLALSYCHKEGVLHRDIKPENMILTGEDILGIADCKVIDFGVAVRDDSLERGIFGTLSHIAPEVAAQKGDIYTAKADVWAVGVTAFQLLTGMLPFGRPTMKAGCRQGLRHIARYKGFDEDVAPKVQDVPGWENRSPEAQQFVRWLLTADADKRPTCSEALDHAWLQMYKAETESLTQEMIQSLARYPSAPPLVRCCLYAIAARQNIPDLERFGTAFLRIDRDGKGKLSPDDLAAALGRKSMPIAINADHVIAAADLDHSGEINFTEFVAACLYYRHVQRGTLEDLLRGAFEALDTDRDNLVSVSEIRDLFRERDAQFLEQLPQDRPFDLRTWCSSLQNICASTPVKQAVPEAGRCPPQRQVASHPVANSGYAIGQTVAYFSASQGNVWLMTKVVSKRGNDVELACKPGYFLGLEEQAEKMQAIASPGQAVSQPPCLAPERGRHNVPGIGVQQLQPHQHPITAARPGVHTEGDSKSQGYVMPNLLSAPPRGLLEARGHVAPDAGSCLPAHLLSGLQQGRVTCRQPIAMVHR